MAIRGYSDTLKDFRTASILGKASGSRPFTITGTAAAIQTSETPCLLWDARTAFAFQTTAQTLEIVSSSALDTAAGTGARTVYITTVSSTHVEQTQTVTLNGTTPVALTGTHLTVNSMVVLTAGSGNTNAGNITLRVSGAGATQGYISAGHSLQRAIKYTVPSGKTLVIDNFYLNALNLSGTTIRITLNFNIRLENGVVLVTQENYLSSANTPISITLPTGLRVEEKTTVYASIEAVSANNAYLSMSMSGFLATNSVL